MAKIEIEETELANLKRVNDVAALVGKHPKARALLQEAVALAAPDEVGPEHRMRSEVNEALSAIREDLRKDREEREKEREERKAEEAKREMERRWVEGRTKARDAGYTAEGLEQLEAFMEKHEVFDHMIAIPAFERENPPPEPVVTGGSRWNFFDVREGAENDAALKDLLSGNDEGFLARAIPSALKEVRGG
jgi:hypothetical protein